MEGDLRPLSLMLAALGYRVPTQAGILPFRIMALMLIQQVADRPADVAFGHDDSAIRLTDLNADLLDHKTLGEVREIGAPQWVIMIFMVGW